MNPAQAQRPAPNVRTTVPERIVQLSAGLRREARGIGADSSRPQRLRCRLDTTGRGVVQRKFFPNGQKAEDFLNLIKYNSTQQGKIKDVDASETLNVDVRVSPFPPPQLNDEILGITSAVIETNTAPVILNGSAPLNKHTLQGQLKGMKSMDIFVEVFESFPTKDGSQQVSMSKQLFSMVHEFERHVFPFVELYKSIAMAQFNSEVLSDDADLVKLSNELLEDTSRHGAVHQHVSPELSARTMLAQENILESLKESATSHDELANVAKLHDELYEQLQKDTQGRGVDMAAMGQHYQSLKS
jgi:hypothetical protein